VPDYNPIIVVVCALFITRKRTESDFALHAHARARATEAHNAAVQNSCMAGMRYMQLPHYQTIGRAKFPIAMIYENKKAVL